MSTVTIDNLIYSLSGTTASITGYASPPSGNLVIPSTITVSGTTYNVTSIGQQAFLNVTTLASVNFNSPSSLISIGDAAFFGCTSLTSITLPSSLTSIGNSAFSVCTSLTSINIPSSVTSIDEGGFSGCTSLRNITINSFISNLGTGFFGLNNTNTSWTFNYSGAIPDGVCNGRTGVTSVTIGSGITSIGASAFQGCTGLASIILLSSVTSIGASAFQGCTGLASVTLPSFLTSIGNNAFNGCTGLASVTLPSSLTSIGNNAFRQSGLTSITIPSSVTSIGFAAFAYTPKLTNITVDDNNLNFSSQDGVLFNKNKTILIKYPTWNSRLIYTVPSTVTTIENRSFGVLDYLENILQSVVLNENLLTILDFAFRFCQFNVISIPNSVTSIGYGAFYECINLTSVTFLGLIPTVDALNFTNASDNVIYDQALNAGNPNLSAMLALFTTNKPIVPICFPAGTPVVTDQGIIVIDKINPAKNTIRGKKIVAITKTVTLEDKIVCIEKDALAPNVPSQKTLISRNHEILYNKKMIKAKQLIGQVDGVYNKKYNGEILYNILLETHEKMLVNNLIVETLDPKNIVAQLYNGSLSVEERNNAIVTINQAASEYKKQYGKLK